MPYVDEGLMELGDWQVELDYDPAVATWDADDWLDPDPENGTYRHLLVYEGERLITPPLVLLRRQGDERGFVIGGRGIEWWQGGDVGPLIAYREFISGRNRLANGDFATEFGHWARREGTLWVHEGAPKVNGNTQADDALVYERTMDVRAGQQWRAEALISRVGLGAGRLRLRVVYTGRFSHQNLFPFGSFESGGWFAAGYTAIASGGQRSGSKAMVIGPIPKPQVVVNPTFAGGTGWSPNPNLTFPSSGVVCSQIPYPQLLPDPGFESGPGFPWAAPDTGDLGFVNDPSKARSGSWVVKAGPNVQKQIIRNPTFDASLGFWFQSSDLAEPDNVFYHDPGGGLEGSPAATTDGAATADRTIKYLRADYVSGGGVDRHPVLPGEEYRLDVNVRRAPNTDGYAYASVSIPHPTVANAERWYKTSDATPNSGANDTFQLLTRHINIPANRFALDVLWEVHDHNTGYWAVDEITMTRTRGNRDRTVNVLPVPLEPNSAYRLQADVTSGDDQQVGVVRIGILLHQAGEEDMGRDATQGHTDYEWRKTVCDFTPTDGQTSGSVFIACEDVVGQPMYVDNLELLKVSNNARQTVGQLFAVIPGQRYLLGLTHVSDAGVTRGTVTAGVRFLGQGLPDSVVRMDAALTAGAIEHPTMEIAPPPGYTVGVPFIRFTDVEGGNWTVRELTVIQMDNNRASAESFPIDLIPERSYQLQMAGRSDLAVTNGYVFVSVKHSSVGRSDLVVDGPAVEITGGTWKLAPFDFTVPSGYRKTSVLLTGVDIDSGPFFIDDITIVDTDSSTSVADVISNATYAGPTTIGVTTTAPLGAERVHVAVVAEREGYGWTVHNVSLARSGETPQTGQDVIRSILRDPDTGEEMSVRAGDIDAGEVIPADWEVRDTVVREAMRQFAVLASPPLEWWTDVDRRQHWGSADSLFLDHAPGTEGEIVLLDGDLQVQDLSPPQDNAEGRVDRVKLIGAERPSATGRADIITAEAVDVTNVRRDYNGRPANRSLLLEDSTADHPRFAEAHALAALAANIAPSRTVDATLSDTRTYPPLKPGDWIYVHKRTAGLVDPGAYPVETLWGTLHPMRLRVLGRRRELGPGYRLVLRKGPGEEMELPHTTVRWARANRTTLTLGDRRPADITTDASGRPPADALLRLRASSPR